MGSRGSGRIGGPASDAGVRENSFRHDLPETNVAQLPRLERDLQIGGAAAWVSRVRSAFGLEALFDPDFRFLAVSKAGRTTTSIEGITFEHPESIFAGRRYIDLLPVRKSLLGDGYDGFEGLRARGFFQGRMLGAQIHLELNFGFHFLNCVMELWAVRTVDKGILAHSLIHPTEQKTPSAGAPGIEIFSVAYH
jgi:hypothetical protein